MKKNKLFDFAIGNPPYQEENDMNARKPPIYHVFMDNAYMVAEKVELITPARFLFNAGQTPKEWNSKMLNDEHLKVLSYEADGKKIFPQTDIKGGVCITYHDSNKKFEPIRIFIAYDELRSIFTKVSTTTDKSLSDIVTGAVPYRFTQKFATDFPDYISRAGKSFDLRTNVIDNLDGIVFFAEKPNADDDFVRIFGLHNAKRCTRWIKRKYIDVPDNFEKYKVFVPESNGSGAIGEVLSTPLIGTPLIGHTQTFISIGCFNTQTEAENLLKYIKSKFSRVMLGILKITQHNPSPTWKLVPLQNFTTSSDIDWFQSIHDIDQQLYRKYGLSDDEIEFIETHVKEMN